VAGGEFGNVFKLTPPASGQNSWHLTQLYGFVNATGHFPYGSLVFDRSGALYGTTRSGPGSNGPGTAFRLAPPTAGQSTWQETPIVTFGTTKIPVDVPDSGLLIDSGGNLYGTASFGTTTAASPGAVYELSPPTAGKTDWTYRTLYQFTGGLGGANASDGAQPSAPLVLGNDGSYYGMTVVGGSSTTCPVQPSSGQYAYAHGCGTIYRLTPPSGGKAAWTETVLYRFTGTDDGAYPVAGLLVRDGALYGTTPYGGKYGFGTAFKLVP